MKCNRKQDHLDRQLGITAVIAQVNRRIFVKLFQKVDQLPYCEGPTALFCSVSGSLVFDYYCVIHVACSFAVFVLSIYFA